MKTEKLAIIKKEVKQEIDKLTMELIKQVPLIKSIDIDVNQHYNDEGKHYFEIYFDITLNAKELKDRILKQLTDKDLIKLINSTKFFENLELYRDDYSYGFQNNNLNFLSTISSSEIDKFPTSIRIYKSDKDKDITLEYSNSLRPPKDSIVITTNDELKLIKEFVKTVFPFANIYIYEGF